MNPNRSDFIEFCKTENALSEDTTKCTCEGIMSIDECERVLIMTENNKTPDTDGITSVFYPAIGTLSAMVRLDELAF